ncbi:cytochrome p450 [Aspergillus japonicus CBS 114.51]|uniref:Cytochrome p450 n=1 Tax=Aspergillus japonicus CBS 114.51 TaxID=1448312 RepID=A0A8T8X9U8_ASPJA|nr:cytochrome p450 [Aspergillus japonicus CBS 114.51]RAH84983.1 cytochrome p450 [Aspergillus japonicus CBS 114.51]
MLLRLTSAVNHAFDPVRELSPNYVQGAIVLLATLLSTWGLWRLWRFTIQPLFRPNEPLELPYWVPYLNCLGHAGAFFEDCHQLMRRAVKQLGTREPFALTLAGDRYYVVTSPADIRPFFANINALSLDGFLNQVLIGFGCGEDRLHTLWQRNQPGPINPKGKSLIHLTEDLFKQHLLPGPTFDTLLSRYRGAIQELLSWSQLEATYPTMTGKETEAISLYDLCSDFLINATQMTLFDPALFAIDPEMTTELRTFTDEFWQLIYRSRFIDSTRVRRILAQYTKAFNAYLRLPPQARAREAWVIRTLIQTYTDLGIHEDDQAAMMVMIYWTGDANAYKAAFWVLAHILYDPTLRELIQEETVPAVGPNGKVDMAYLRQNCPRLSSIYHEVLRLTKRDAVLRRVVQDTELGGKQFRKGSFAIIPSCQLHDSLETYGHDSLLFNPERFLKRPELTQDPAYFPYGGGVYYCPGRHFATLEIFAFVAVMLNRFDVHLAWPKQEFPRKDESVLTFGISRPLPGDDLYVVLKKPEDADA